MNILFVCSRNQWRSPTAEKIYSNYPGLQVRSAGTEPSARIRLSAKQLAWADVIFVMEKKHKQRIMENFREQAEDKQLIVLDIPDDYKYMDAELIDDLRVKINAFLNG